MQQQGRRKTMRTIREIARLHLNKHLSLRSIAGACNLSVSTVQGYVKKIKALDLEYEAIAAMPDSALTKRLQPVPKIRDLRPGPDLQGLVEELKRSGTHITRQLLFEEYQQQHPDGYKKTRFYEMLNEWEMQDKATMRLTHTPGEKLFIDFSGDKPSWINPETGELMTPELYVAVLGGTSYTFACAVSSQKAEDFAAATVKAFEYFGGCPQLLVIDNLKSGVSHACYYDPEINPTFADLARHYSVAVLPARVRKPRDKAKVETGVLQVQRRILAPLRNRRFFSLEELNAAIAEELEALNSRLMYQYCKSRKELFLELERHRLAPLPKERFTIGYWKKAKVHVDYHVSVDKSFYSVPYRLIGKQVDIKYTGHLVSVYHEGEVVAQHIRTLKLGQYVTDSAHMPHEHRFHKEWSPERIRSWGAKIGPNTAALMERIMLSKLHPEHGFRSCLGVIRLAKTYSPERLERAAIKALELNLTTYKSIKSMMAKGLDTVTLFDQHASLTGIAHQNIRGGDYYATER
jgi:transposase